MPSLEFRLYLKEMRFVFLGMKKKKLASILSTFLGTCWSCDACFNVVVDKCIVVVVENNFHLEFKPLLAHLLACTSHLKATDS